MNMKTNKTVFLQQTKDLPTLYMYMVFVESLSPILFACRDNAANVYICSCHCQNAEKCEWIISPTTYERLIDLLTDKLSIREIFLVGSATAYVATLFANTKNVEISERTLIELNTLLPTAGCYMEADPDEFSEELAVLESEMAMSLECWRISFTESFNTLFNCFSVQVSIPEPVLTALPAGCYTSCHELLFAI